MRPVSDDVLIATAQISATLIGLLLIGVLFYAETGLRQLSLFGSQPAAYLRAGTRFVLLLYSLALAVSLALLVLEPTWATVVFFVVGATLVVSLVEFALRARDLRRVMARMHPASLWIAWPPVVLALGLPWIDGWSPGREQLTAAVLLAGATGFVATASLVLLTFDLGALEREGAAGRDPAATSTEAPAEHSAEPPADEPPGPGGRRHA